MDITVESCARCGKNHESLSFQEFTHPMEDPEGDWTHWATCPTNGEPVILRIEIEEV